MMPYEGVTYVLICMTSRYGVVFIVDSTFGIFKWMPLHLCPDHEWTA